MAQSPELAGGAGFAFEDAADAIYLAALLGEEPAPATRGIVVRVALQQTAFGEPLDDLIVDSRAPDGLISRLSLQIKRELKISAAKTNADFRDIVVNAAKTYAKPDFRQDIDQFGAITGTISDAAKRNFKEVCEIARVKSNASEFFAHLRAEGVTGKARREIPKTLATILSATALPATEEAVFQILRHFVLLHFDVSQTGSTITATAISQLSHALEAGETSRTPALLSGLQRIAQDGAGRAAVFDRNTLRLTLKGEYRFKTSTLVHVALERLSEEANAGLSQIQSKIDGVEITRTALTEKLAQQAEKHLFTQIVGLPGTGKSALLRNFAAQYADRTILFIRTDRLSGTGWASYAHSIGANAGVEDLLVEIEALGTPILFIDGLDRVELAHRGVVKDLIQKILESPALVNWRIVATIRDTGMEDLRTWLPPALFREGGISTVDVPPLNDEEAKFLAEQKPVLNPLLFGDDRVKEIARRPFFASVLARNLTQDTSGVTPKSEVELIDVWWKGGGYDATDQKSQHRQRLLVSLAKAGAPALGRRIAIKGLDVDALGQLKRDGVIRDVVEGHTVQFAHDIFFEWAFVHLLIDQDDKWLDEILAVGEPPVLGRAVELLSQTKFTKGWNWEDDLKRLEATSARPQWRRVWLIAPFSAPTFADRSTEYTQTIFQGDFSRLRQLLVWFQAERTQANPRLLERPATSEEERRNVIATAESLAWPSDWQTWARLCRWINANIGTVPVEVVPDVVAAFEIWQNMFSTTENWISKWIVTQCATWLQEIEEYSHPDNWRERKSRWSSLDRGEIEELEKSLRNIVLWAANSLPEYASAYLKRVTRGTRLREAVFEDVIAWSRVLAPRLGAELADLTLAVFKDELPDERAARLAKDRSTAFLPAHNLTDWHELGLHHVHAEYLPTSALREPFHSLFAYAPNEALRVTRELANHVSTAWRQLAKFEMYSRGTPLPLELAFPWGKQIFWGDHQTYGRYRGTWPPYSLGCAFMAMEEWAFREVDGGRDVNEVIRTVVEGHDSCSVLGIAIALALSKQCISETTLPLATSQRLWNYDITRVVQDGSRQPLFGFWRQEHQEHLKSVIESNKRPVRGLARSDLSVAQACELWIDRSYRERLEDGTIKQYRQHVDLHIKPFIGELKVIDVTPAKVEAFRDQLLRDRSRPLARAILTSVKGVFKEAKRLGHIASNPATDTRVKLSKRDKRRARVPTREEIKLILILAEEIWPYIDVQTTRSGETKSVPIPWHPLLVTALFSGLRISELRGLTWDHIDLQSGRLKVRQRADLNNRIGAPKSEAGSRDIPLAPIVRNTLARWRLSSGTNRLNLVFPTENGTIHTNSNIFRRCWQPLLKRLAESLSESGKKHFRTSQKLTFHSLRHAAASLFIEQGWGAKKVQAVVGHASIQVTFDTYGHLWENEDDDLRAVAEIEKRLLG
jgi:integrase